MSRLPLALFLCSLSLLSAQTRVLTQSTDNTLIEPLNSVTCNTSISGVRFHWDNSFFRIYDLATEGFSGSVRLDAVRVGINSAQAAAGTSQPLEVRVRILPRGFPISIAPYASFPPILVMETVSVPDASSGFFAEIPLPDAIVVAPTEQLMVEVFTPVGLPTAPNGIIFLGANSLGETAPAYTWSPDCLGNSSPPIPVSATGATTTHFLLDLAVQELSSTLAISQPGGPGSPLRLAMEELQSGQDYWNLFSFTPCTGPVGTGPILGLCLPDPIGTLNTYLTLPRTALPVKLLATSSSFDWFLPVAIPAGTVIEAVTLNATVATQEAVSNVVRYTVL